MEAELSAELKCRVCPCLLARLVPASLQSRVWGLSSAAVPSTLWAPSEGGAAQQSRDGAGSTTKSEL